MLQRLKIVLAALTRISNGFKWLAVYMSLVGLITFPLFIHEEAIQTTMFGTWQAGPADRWDIVLDGTNIMENINTSMKIINWVGGWINPLSFLSYRAYGQATDSYIEASRAKIMAKAPHLMVGSKVSTEIIPKKIERLGDGRWFASNGTSGFITTTQPQLGQPISIEGTYELFDGRLVIKEN